MNYTNIYYKIIDNRKNTPYKGYTEEHHIIPKSLGGGNNSSNLVRLSAREHFICHLLLTKMYKKNSLEYHKMVKAFMMMLVCKSKGQDRLVTSKRYESLRVEFSKIQSLAQSGMRNSQYGKTKSQETKDKISSSLKEYHNNFDDSINKKLIKQTKNLQNTLKKRREIELYRYYYSIYKEVGWDQFIKKTSYNKSKPNLVQRFKKLLPEFIPQNGKKRGYS